VPAKIAAVISKQLEIPTSGIGAGVGTDGQILLCHDLLGVFTDFKPKFTKRFSNLTEVAVKGITQYIAEVKSGAFPDDDHSYGVDEKDSGCRNASPGLMKEVVRNGGHHFDDDYKAWVDIILQSLGPPTSAAAGRNPQ